MRDWRFMIRCSISNVISKPFVSVWQQVWVPSCYQEEQRAKRLALPNAEIMIHQPSGGAQGQATEIQIAAEHILKTRQKLNEILAANTGQPLDVIKVDTERDNFMTAQEAKRIRSDRRSNHTPVRICPFNMR